MKNSKIIAVFALFIIMGCREKIEKHIIVKVEPTWVDLTYPFDSTTLYWPNNVKTFEHATDADGISAGGYYYSSYSICTPEHGGTHLDAPIHFAEGRESVDKIPLNSLIGDAVLVDVSVKALANRDYLISVSDLEAWEKTNGKIDSSTIVLFRTGYGKFYPDRKNYFGTDLKGPEAIPLLHFPGISEECARWLVDKRDVKAVGLDTPSLDYGQSKDFRAHRILLGANRPGFENLANLGQLPARNLRIIALPMKIGKGSGAPLRIIAGIMKKEIIEN